MVRGEMEGADWVGDIVGWRIRLTGMESRCLAISLQESKSITIHWTPFYHCAASSWINATMEGVKYLHVIIGLKQYFSESISQKSQCFELFSQIPLAALFSWLIQYKNLFFTRAPFCLIFIICESTVLHQEKRRKICCHNFFQIEEELQYLKWDGTHLNGDIWNTLLSKCQKGILVTCSSTFTLPI